MSQPDITAQQDESVQEDPSGQQAPSGQHDLTVADATVDARGHRCPMPLLMAKRGLNQLQPGQTLCLLATDPGSCRDVEIFCGQSGHELLHSAERDGEFHYTLCKR